MGAGGSTACRPALSPPSARRSGRVDGGTRTHNTLSLDSTHVTDKSANQLRQFTKLKTLNLYHTLVTPKGYAELKAALPGCRIIWDPDSSLPNRRRS